MKLASGLLPCSSTFAYLEEMKREVHLCHALVYYNFCRSVILDQEEHASRRSWELQTP